MGPVWSTAFWSSFLETCNAANQVPTNANTLIPGVGPMVTLENGTPVPEGFIVTPHAAADGSMTAAQVMQIIQRCRAAGSPR